MQIIDYILSAYPEFEPIRDRISPFSFSVVEEANVAEAVSKIIIGQMLSRQAAQTIHERAEKARLERSLNGIWELTAEELATHGVSGRKAQSIISFGSKYNQSPASYEAWRQLDYCDLVSEVSSHWGLSSWSADMLAIFYFGLKDVFPNNDGTIKKARSIVENEFFSSGTFDPQTAAPYRTYLALFLWQLIDQRII